MKKILALTLVLLVIAGCGASTTKLGLGMSASVSSKAPTESAAGKTQADVTACALSVDSKGKIVGVYFDVVQAKAEVTATGEITPATDIKTKKELGADYGMLKASAIGKEWFEQIDALEKYMTGKTVSDALAMPTATNAEGSTSADVEELKTSCTMSVDAFLATLEKAYANAK